MADEYGGQLGQMWRGVYAQARQIADDQIKAAIGNIVRGGKVVPGAIAPGPPGTVLTSPSGGGGTSWSAPGSGSGTVTSVGLSLPSSIITVTGSPVTAAGTLDGHVLANQAAHTVWAGDPVSGSNPPTFRLLVQADIPALDASAIATGTFAAGRLPLATATTPGAVQIGSGLAVSGGVVSVAGGGSGTPAAVTPPARIWRAARGAASPAIVATATLESDGQHNAFPGIAVRRDGSLIAVYRRGSSHVSAASSVVARTSADGGATWSARVAIQTAGTGHDYRDPSIVCTATGRLILTYFDYQISSGLGVAIATSYSDDNGATWSAPATIAPFSADQVTSGAILQHSSGVLLLPVYGGTGTSDYAGVVRSTDDGATWGGLITVAGVGFDEACMIELPDRSILCFLRYESTTAGLYTIRSADAGLTWSGGAGIGFSAWGGRPTAVLVPVSQAIVLFYRSASAQQCAWRYSTDLGASWSAETIINTNQYVYAGATALSDRSVAFVYSDQYASLASADVQFVAFSVAPIFSGDWAGAATGKALAAQLAGEGLIIDSTTLGTAPTGGIYAPLVDSAKNIIFDTRGQIIMTRIG